MAFAAACRDPEGTFRRACSTYQAPASFAEAFDTGASMVVAQGEFHQTFARSPTVIVGNFACMVTLPFAWAPIKTLFPELGWVQGEWFGQ